MGIKIGKWNPVSTVSNIFKTPGRELQNWITNYAGATTLGQGQKYLPWNNKAPKAPGAGEDPQVSALRNRLYGEASDFERDLPGFQSRASEQIGREGEQALKSGLKGTRENFNRRGLLYSGLREGGEQDVRGRVASTMAGQKAQSNKELTDLAKSKWQTAANVGLQSYQDSVNREAEIAGINLQNQVARAQMMQALGQTGGYIAGSMYGNRQPQTQQTYTNAGYGNTSPMANNASFGQRGA